MATGDGYVQAVRRGESDRSASHRQEAKTIDEIEEQQLVAAVQRELRFVSNVPLSLSLPLSLYFRAFREILAKISQLQQASVVNDSRLCPCPQHDR